ncbi:site-2 protease family protein [Pendulispora brunnea]|uniref:Zinc metalloprotease n=1 Tax=Pendulispora brunnea TaxID=2905690 RepID=A0ABZ2KLD9_9BACT
MRTLRLGKLFGVDVAIDRSWIFIFLLMSWNLASLFGRWHPNWSALLVVAVAITAALLFFASLLLHEFAHSLTGKAFGIPVRNITLFLFGGVSHFENEPRSAGADFLISIVGPLASIAIGLFFFFLFTLTHFTYFTFGSGADITIDPERALSGLGPFGTLFLWLGPINVTVGLFNLIPAFPLDGGRVLRSLIWAVTKRPRNATRTAAGVGQIMAWLMMGLGIAAIFGLRVPFVARGPISGIWFAFIGWFLHSAALRTLEQTHIEELLEGVDVARLMRTRGTAIDATTPISQLVNEVFLRSEESIVPVLHEGHFLGMLSSDQVRAIPSAEWTRRTAGELVTPVQQLQTTTPTEPMIDAMRKLVASDVGVLPVVEETRLVGLLLSEDIARWIELHRGRGSMFGGQRPLWQG